MNLKLFQQFFSSITASHPDQAPVPYTSSDNQYFAGNWSLLHLIRGGRYHVVAQVRVQTHNLCIKSDTTNWRMLLVLYKETLASKSQKLGQALKINIMFQKYWCKFYNYLFVTKSYQNCFKSYTSACISKLCNKNTKVLNRKKKLLQS